MHVRAMARDHNMNSKMSCKLLVFIICTIHFHIAQGSRRLDLRAAVSAGVAVTCGRSISLVTGRVSSHFTAD